MKNEKWVDLAPPIFVFNYRSRHPTLDAGYQRNELRLQGIAGLRYTSPAMTVNNNAATN
ncbi:MAG: hypothetical protein LBF08_01945 [Dysgonamonadaceae bacterium]|jgi:hypothetical protein|nr:hypothetical protein [Dysgonamonadaceae bacterium]